MKSLTAANEEKTELADAGSTEQPSDLKRIVAAIAAALRETVVGFEETVTRITEITALRPGGADRDLVVALQNFDRLQQEFATLGDVLAKLSVPLAENTSGKTEFPIDDHMVLASISLADLKERLSGHLRSLRLDISMPDGGTDEAIF